MQELKSSLSSGGAPGGRLSRARRFGEPERALGLPALGDDVDLELGEIGVLPRSTRPSAPGGWAWGHLGSPPPPRGERGGPSRRGAAAGRLRPAPARGAEEGARRAARRPVGRLVDPRPPLGAFLERKSVADQNKESGGVVHVEKVVEKKLSQAEVEKMKQEIETELRDNVTDFLSPSKLDQIKREAEAKAKAGQDSVGSSLATSQTWPRKRVLAGLDTSRTCQRGSGRAGDEGNGKKRKATRNRNFPVHCTALSGSLPHWRRGDRQVPPPSRPSPRPGPPQDKAKRDQNQAPVPTGAGGGEAGGGGGGGGPCPGCWTA